MTYSDHERRLLSRYFSEVDKKDHADVYLVRNLPPEVAATLNGVYSRSSLSMRDNFLQRLKKGLEETGRTLESLPVPEAETDVLSGVLADKSGQFLKTYAIDHGHNSLREGSVLHLAVENVSQLATRFVQRERRCSFEESSTRYISFSNEGHWRDPDVAAEGGKTAAAYEEVIRSTFTLYGELTQKLVDHLQKARPIQPEEKPAAYQRALRAEAFDAARYLLTPSLLTKWGVVIDARTLSDVITGLLSHPLAEFQLIGARLKEQGDKVVKSLLAHAEPNEFLRAQHRDLPRFARRLGTAPRHRGERRSYVALISYDQDLDNRLVASLLFEHSPRSFQECRNAADELSAEQRARLVRDAFAARGRHDPWPAGLEGAQPFEFEILVDFGAYRDIGRHRKGFQQQQLLTTAHGFVVPPLIAEAGCEREYTTSLERAAELQYQVSKKHPLAAGYVTPFAFLQRVRILFDPRQVAYFVELRSGPEGHFAYRKIALDVYRELERVSPLFASFVRAQTGEALLGRIVAETAADVRRARRMKQAGDA